MSKEVVIYPSLKKLEFSTKGLVSTRILGKYKSVFRGRGMEFDSYREYSTGDDASQIDWKASVRSSNPMIKTFVEERKVNVFFLVDVSSSMLFASKEKTKSTYAAELVASLCYAVLESKDNAGFAFFNNGIVYKMPSSSSEKAFHKLLREIIKPEYYGGSKNLANVLPFFISYLPRNSIAIIVSDFIGLQPGWEKHLKYCATMFDVIGVMVRDPADRAMPESEGRVVIRDSFANDQLMIVPKNIKEDYEAYVKLEEKRIKEEFIKANAEFISLSTDEPFVKPVLEFFKRRQKSFR